jgi:ParB family transcriptional regulator, chromosome partitioning protein
MTTTIERIDVDPASLLVDVNIRDDNRVDKDFLASVKEHGVIVPITAVRTASGELRVRHGHRRTQAAVEGGLNSVPVEVVGDESEDDAAQVDRILRQYAENEHRAGLTSAEKVDVVTSFLPSA